MFNPVNSKVHFPQLEKNILSFWKDRQVFEHSIRQGSPSFILYDGPPTANGRPGIHHVLSRVFKDVIPRYKTMKGFYAPRKAGWDTHGLPVELEIERELNFSSKAQIEEYGVDRFNARCKESVNTYLDEWNSLTERIGFWIDLEDPYVTYHTEYVESVWWIIKQLWERGLIYQGYRVTPHCPRCGTSLSSHEVSLGYQDDTEDPSLYIQFKLHLGKSKDTPFSSTTPTYFLVWTTTPWTLPGNVALAVAPDASYALIQLKDKDQRFILAEPLLSSSIKDEYDIIDTFPGSKLVGLTYEPLYDPFKAKLDVQKFDNSTEGKALLHPYKPKGRTKLTYPVIPGEFVSMEDGTGIVHIAPAFGEADYLVGEDCELHFIQQVDLQGNIIGDYRFSGLFVKNADPIILDELASQGLLYRRETIRHTYPFCWRCESPLLYYAKPTWYAKTTAVKDRLVEANEQIRWYPNHIKHGRFGDWLENNVDWAFSRERYWGTPLNIWQCDLDPAHQECIGSIAELTDKPALEGLTEPMDPHRPFVDHVTFRCSYCNGTMQRLPEVLDAWFDSGAMPVAQWHYPFENQDVFEQRFPADYICEAVDQTRGWFYTLHALSTLLFDGPCFRNVICLGHILDVEGEKMSKAKGNVVDPWQILDNQGADALRWYMFTSTPPGNVRRFSSDQVTEVMRRFFLTLWNTYSFFVMYANIDQFDPSQSHISTYESDLDRWILSELNQLIQKVDTSLEGYDPTGGARYIEEFVDCLSNWYVRRSRRRFWKSENDEDKSAAYSTLYQSLVTIAKLTAPFAPFIAEEMYQNLVRTVYPEAPESVHHCDFPQADPDVIDNSLSDATRLVMKISSLGRSARSKASIKVRQPLDNVIIKTRYATEHKGIQRLAYQIQEELNVKRIEFVEQEEVLNGKEHLSISMEEGYVVALDTRISHELLEEGMSREIVHRLQTMRRNAGFNITDYIITYYDGDDFTSQMIENYSEYIKQETLSIQIVNGIPEDNALTEKQRIGDRQVTLAVKQA
ncbi:MAG: isoleucine--tRNA ligase [Chloroflexota bacterium]|nr:isoleucine--tRNA ligase [Chloroflexota bacterium]